MLRVSVAARAVLSVECMYTSWGSIDPRFCVVVISFFSENRCSCLRQPLGNWFH